MTPFPCKSPWQTIPTILLLTVCVALLYSAGLSPLGAGQNELTHNGLKLNADSAPPTAVTNPVTKGFLYNLAPNLSTPSKMSAALTTVLSDPATKQACKASYDAFMRNNSIPNLPNAATPSNIARLGWTKFTPNLCRTTKLLYDVSGIYTCHSFLTPTTEFTTETASHVVLFPYMDESHDAKDFHAVSYHSLLEGASWIAPITKPMTVNVTPAASQTTTEMPIFLLTFRTPVAGPHKLNINARWFKDFPDFSPSDPNPDTWFTGESEVRTCFSHGAHWQVPEPVENKADPCDAMGSPCQRYTRAIPLTAIRVTSASDSPPPHYLDLPLATTAEAPPDGFWLRAGETKEDCEARKEINARFVTGDACR